MPIPQDTGTSTQVESTMVGPVSSMLLQTVPPNTFALISLES
jgi:hypothetical protein